MSHSVTIRIPLEDLAELVENSLAIRESGIRLSSIVRLAIQDYCIDLREHKEFPPWNKESAKLYLEKQNLVKGDPPPPKHDYYNSNGAVKD